MENLLRVTAITVDAKGNHVRLSGGNNTGKTSTLEGIWIALQNCGRRLREPVRKGSGKGMSRLTLVDADNKPLYTVERTHTEDGKMTLVVTAADGSLVRKPQALLDSMLSDLALDPVSFLSLPDAKHVEAILSCAKPGVPVHQVEELIGEPCPAKPNEGAEAYLMRLGADTTGAWYVRRRDLTRDLDQKRSALDLDRKKLAAMPEAEQTGNVQELMGLLSAQEAMQDARRLAQEEAQRCVSEAGDAARLLRDVETERARWQTGIDETATKIADLTERLQEYTLKRDVAAARFAKGESICTDLNRHALDAAKHVGPDCSATIADLRGKIVAANQQSTVRNLRSALAASVEQLQADVQQLQKHHKHADDVLTGIRNLRGKLLEGLDLGVPGLEVGDGELRLNGVPFSQASMAQRLRVACAVATMQNPRLKLLRVDEAERLDADSEAALLEWADQHSFQVWMTRVSRDKELRVEIVEASEREAVHV